MNAILDLERRVRDFARRIPRVPLFADDAEPLPTIQPLRRAAPEITVNITVILETPHDHDRA